MTTVKDAQLPAVVASRGYTPEQWNALQVIWPNAQIEVAVVALDYCRARSLDPMKHPVHIVKTWDNEKRAYVESIWEGIGSHRTTASRTGDYGGIDEPEFGPMVNHPTWGEYPEWCKITVYRHHRGSKDAFTAKLWFEEVCSTTKDGGLTQRWRKAKRAQLAKCTEAEALRKAFPEELGARPTVEEVNCVDRDEMVDVTPAPEVVEGEVLEPNPKRRQRKMETLEQNLTGEQPMRGESSLPDQGSPPPGDETPQTEEDLLGLPFMGALFPDGSKEEITKANGSTVLKRWAQKWTAERDNIAKDPEDILRRFMGAYEAALRATKPYPEAQKFVVSFRRDAFGLE